MLFHSMKLPFDMEVDEKFLNGIRIVYGRSEIYVMYEEKDNLWNNLLTNMIYTA